MEIKVKKIGIAQGTVGWLSNGLTDETIKIIESTLKGNGNHGLWLKIYTKGIDGKLHESTSHFLAAFNQYGLKPGEYDAACTYELCDASVDRDYMWTDAAWGSLMAFATNWCKLCNEVIENEPVMEIKIKRIALDV